QDDYAIDCFHKGAAGTAQAFGNLDQIEMIHPARCSGHSDEDAPGEEPGGGELQPQDRKTDRARHDVEEHRKSESCDGNSAKHHQDMLEWIQCAPFEMVMARDHERWLGQDFPN